MQIGLQENNRKREKIKMNIYVIINTNHGFEETSIEAGAIHEFTNNGFAEGNYDARVEFSCLPAAVESNAMAVVLEVAKEIADYGEMILFYTGICTAIFKFLNRCHGYFKTVEIQGLDEKSEQIVVTEDMTEEEFEAKVFAILEIEKKKTGRNVSAIMDIDKL